jgi:hypothetical protein
MFIMDEIKKLPRVSLRNDWYFFIDTQILYRMKKNASYINRMRSVCFS